MAIVIDIKLNTSGAGVSRLQKVTDHLKKMDAALDGVNSKLVQMNTLLGRYSALPAIPRMGGGSGGGGSRSPVAKPPTQMARFQDAYQQFKFFDQLSKRTGGAQGGTQRSAALAQAHQMALQMANGGKFGAMNSLLPHIMPKTPASLSKRLMNAVMTTRVGAGAGGLQIAPLIGRLAALHPAIGLAVAAVGAFSMAMNHAKDTAMSFASSRAALGGTSAETAAATRAASSLGLDSKSLADALQSAIQSGAGAGFAGQAGINTMGGPFGDNNYAAKLNKAIKFIVNAPSFDEARRRAEGLGIQDVASGYYLPQSEKNKLGMGKGVSDKEMQGALKLNAQFTALSSVMDRFVSKAMMGPMQGLSNIVELINQNTKLFDALSEAVGAAIFPILNLSKMIGEIVNWVREKLGMQKDDNTAAIKANTQATQGLNRTMHDMRETMGGGVRSRGALPGKLRGNYIDAGTIGALGSGVRI